MNHFLLQIDRTNKERGNVVVLEYTVLYENTVSPIVYINENKPPSKTYTKRTCWVWYVDAKSVNRLFISWPIFKFLFPDWKKSMETFFRADSSNCAPDFYLSHQFDSIWNDLNWRNIFIRAECTIFFYRKENVKTTKTDLAAGTLYLKGHITSFVKKLNNQKTKKKSDSISKEIHE